MIATSACCHRSTTFASVVLSVLTVSAELLVFERCGKDVCHDVLPNNRPEELLNSRLTAIDVTPLAELADRTFDYIVVGGGGGGCPLARTLADGGKSVLLLERGGLRRDHVLTQDIYGSGMVIADERVSQPVITPDGVRTHLGSVLGGGTATGMAIAIEEDAEYWDVLEGLSGESIDRGMMAAAFDWLRPRTSQPMVQRQPYSDGLRRGLQMQGFNVYHGPTPALQKDGTWQAHSLFNSSDGFFRNSADVLLGAHRGEGYRYL